MIQKNYLDPQADELNQKLQQHPSLLKMLSNRGQAIYFPKLGILSQSAQAKDKEINATIGIAVEDNKQPMYLESLKNQAQLDSKDMFPYAPSPGRLDIRKNWKERQIQANSSLKNKLYSNPIVTQALTHGISIAGFLFVDEGQEIISPHLYWENYNLSLDIAYGSRISTYPLFNNNRQFNVKGLEKKLEGENQKKVVIFNFPNNPSGYTPSEPEIENIIQVLVNCANRGNQLVIMVDDAYFGLVFKEGVFTQSIFAKLVDLHTNILAVKIDGPTKEDFVWGFRIGFISFGIKGASESMYQALESKTAGVVRGTISNSSQVSQSLLMKSWLSDNYLKEKKQKNQILKERFDEVETIIKNNPQYQEYFKPLPFNSGYFMCVELLKHNAEDIRQKLLNEYSTGVIVFDNIIRVAFSSTPIKQLPILFDNMYQACQK